MALKNDFSFHQGQRREKDRLESELDRLDRELGSVRMSLKRYHVLKSTI